jgi:hypothetical protein
MKRVPVICLAVIAMSALALPELRAQEKTPPRGYINYTPANGSGVTYRFLAPSRDQPTTRQAIYNSPQAAASQRGMLPAVGQQVVVRPVSWGARTVVAYVYPSAAYGQYVQAPGQPPADAQPSYGGAPGTYPGGINPYKYSYAGSNMGGYAYAPVYNSGYYTSGCYEANACCRCCRRRCTLFGGMAYGCGAGCYTTIPAACPTACAYAAPYGTMIAPPANGAPTPAPSAAPPTSTPPTPAPLDENAPPQPIEKKVSPAPQANLFPRIPGLPPDA